MPAGRPTAYRPEFCEFVMEIGRDGGSVVEMAEICDTTKKTLHNWAAEHEEFLHAFTRARQLSQIWWEQFGKKNLITPQGINFNQSVYTKSMSCRFPDDWRDNSRLEHVGADGGAIKSESKTLITIDDIKNVVDQILKPTPP